MPSFETESMLNNDEVYPKAPLSEVVFEIQFPGEPAAECHRDELFEFVRSDFPIVRVPEAAAERNFKFRTYQFASTDGSYTIMAGINQLGYSSKKYTGYADFKKQLLPTFRFFCERFKIHTLRRVGFRYINAIPFTRENGLIPLARYLKSKCVLSPNIPDHFDQCSIALVQSLEKGKILTQIETMTGKNATEEALLLDFDYFKTENLKTANLDEYLEESHSKAKAFFENIITDQYREFIRGKPLL